MRRFAGQVYGFWSKIPMSDAVWVHITAALLRLMRWPTRLSFDADRRMFKVTQGANEIWLARRSRVARIIWSLDGRLDELHRGYGLHRVSGLEGGTVLDIGANIGEVSILFRQLGATVHAFEPDPAEFACLEANADSLIRTYQSALWNETGTATLFLANGTGDTSLLTPVKSDSATVVKTITLDDWAEHNLEPGLLVDLLKLEAEGAEPEILEGAKGLLARVRYITADVGFERPGDGGLDSTLPAVTNFLLKRNFSVIWVGSPRLVVLFKNDLLPDSE